MAETVAQNAAPAIIVKTPITKMELFLDEGQNPPVLHILLPYRDNAKNLWLLRQAIKQVEGSAGPNPKLILPK